MPHSVAIALAVSMLSPDDSDDDDDDCNDDSYAINDDDSYDDDYLTIYLSHLPVTMRTNIPARWH
jgi:hypothetical protein